MFKRFYTMRFLFLFSLGFFSFSAFAGGIRVAQAPNSETDSLLSVLVQTGPLILKHPEFAKRDSANRVFSQTLALFLQEDVGFEQPLDTLTNMIRLSDPKNEVVVCTWQMPDATFTYKRFGIVAAEGRRNKIEITILEDKLAEMGDEAAFKYLRPDDWFGALYYKMIPQKEDGETFYTLLGYAPNQVLNRKVVEVMTIDNRGRPRFGKKIFLIERFQDELYKKPPMRLVMKYNPNLVASLKWNEVEEMIVMDHLSPPDGVFKKQFTKYGPDFSYDGLVWRKGWWELQEQVEFNSQQRVIIRPPAKPAPKNN